MNEIIKTNDLSFYNDQGIITLSAKQYDTGRKFVFNIVNDGEIFDLSDYNASLRILKADGKQFQGEECCYIENNQVVIDTSIGNGNQILTSVGNNTCEIQLSNSKNKCVTTWDFNINVHGKVHDGSNIISEDSWDLLDQMMNSAEKVDEIILEFEALENQINQAEQSRVDAENARVEVELSRVESENARVDAELLREQNVQTSIDLVNTALNELEASEQIRIANEAIRQSSENDRIANEKTRQDEYNTLTEQVENLLGSLSGDIITGVQVNGENLELDENKKVNIIVPTKVSDLTNDVPYIESDGSVKGIENDSGDYYFVGDTNIKIATENDLDLKVDKEVILESEDEVNSVTKTGFLADALAIKDSLTSVREEIDDKVIILTETEYENLSTKVDGVLYLIGEVVS